MVSVPRAGVRGIIYATSFCPSLAIILGYLNCCSERLKSFFWGIALDILSQFLAFSLVFLCSQLILSSIYCLQLNVSFNFYLVKVADYKLFKVFLLQEAALHRPHCKFEISKVSGANIRQQTINQSAHCSR